MHHTIKSLSAVRLISWSAAVLLAGGLLLTLLNLSGCRDVPVDRLYALPLDHAPADADWASALPRLVPVRGGYRNVPAKLADIDNDTVHTSTASCHHGAAMPEPVNVDMRAFYTEHHLYLRISWLDPTRDDAMRQWVFDGREWISAGNLEDGFGLMWDARGSYADFSCSYACHIDDFGVSGANFHARNRMKLNRRDALVDLWNWKASRTGRYGFVDDRYLAEDGMHADVPGEIFRPNSKMTAGSTSATFLPGDAPLYDFDGRSIGDQFRLAGSVAPGYLVERPAGGRADITALSDYQAGRWTVVLRRALDTGDTKDVVFLPGDEAGVAFGLSIMDNTLDQHYASSTEERLVLMTRVRSLTQE